MSGLEGARCVGKWWLFESILLNDHLEARELCDQCPAIDACSALIGEQMIATRGASTTPVGTWAGKLYGSTGEHRRQPREHGTERGYQQHRHQREKSCGECRVAHNTHSRRQANPQVDGPFRTPVRVESESKVRVPHRRANDGEAAHSSTRPRGA